MRELIRMATEARADELRLQRLPEQSLRDLSVLVDFLWANEDHDPDGARSIRFEWLGPLIDSELRRRRAMADQRTYDPVHRRLRRAHPKGPSHLSTVFQPLVDFGTGSRVAYEALTRVSAETGDGSPQPFLEAARREGRIVEVDRDFWITSLQSAEVNDLHQPHSLLINVEPESFQAGLLEEVPPARPVVIELTERALLSAPGELLTMVQQARAAGHAIAIDDLGANPASLALVPLIDPDVVKLDLRLIQDRPDADIARIMSALNTHTSNADVVVVAEGVETAKHLVTAQAHGATHGQGWHFSAPIAEVSDGRDLPGITVRPRRRVTPSSATTPFEVVAQHIPPKSSDRALLVQMSIFLEARARASGDSAVVLSTFQHASNVTPGATRRYLDLAEHCALVMVHVDGPTPMFDGSAVQVSRIPSDDPLLTEWDIVVLTADFAAVLVARETDASRHAEGVYDFSLSHDRGLAVEAARHLILRAT
ncbi:sensor domain-containing phosphodiesterase [Herbiconiux liukaitaii]|uniref:sensor domain-containing phosphodiesterase n=1 Tax=Herbiconiux liukaitaii TaxID=3342799 RepID=UPI0035BB8199